MNVIVLNRTGQTLRHVPPGPVGAASFELVNLRFSAEDAARLIGSGAATVASWSLTTTALAGQGRRDPARIQVSETAGAVVGSHAAITGPDGARELVLIDAVSLDAYVQAASPLAGTYESGSTVAGVTISCPVPDAWAADEDELERSPVVRVTWTYTLDGRLYRVPEIVKFVRHTASGVGPLGQALLEAKVLYPEIDTRLPDGASFAVAGPLLLERVENDLRARMIEPTRLLAGPQGRELLVTKMAEWASSVGYSPGKVPLAEFQRVIRELYITRLDNLVIGQTGPDTAETNHQDNRLPDTYRGVTFEM